MSIRQLWLSGQLSKLLGVSERTLANWRWAGIGPPFLKIGSAVRYDPEAVERWLEERTHLSTAASGRGQ